MTPGRLLSDRLRGDTAATGSGGFAGAVAADFLFVVKSFERFVQDFAGHKKDWADWADWADWTDWADHNTRLVDMTAGDVQHIHREIISTRL